MPSSPQPPWLTALLQDRSPGPRLYRWTTANVPSASNAPSQSPAAAAASNPDPDSRRIHILGIGNLGRLLASSLSQLPSPPPITLLVHRPSLLEAWSADPGVTITRRDGTVTTATSNIDIEMWSEDPPPTGPVVEVTPASNAITNLIVTTKAPAALPQVDRLRRYIGAGAAVLFVQNGMNKLWPPYGPVYAEARFAPQDQPDFLVGVTSHGVTSLGTFSSLHASPADLSVGPVLPGPSSSSRGSNGSSVPSSYLTGLLTTAPHLKGRAVPRAEIWVLQLEKLVVNAVVNPLTAILRCQNGTLFFSPPPETGADFGPALPPDSPLIQISDLLLRQASAVLQSLIADPSAAAILSSSSSAAAAAAAAKGGDTPYSQASLQKRFSYPALRAMLHRVGAAVRHNTSSMLQDARAGKPTEIREFNGWVVETAAYLDSQQQPAAAAARGLDVSAHAKVVELVEASAVMSVSELAGALPLRLAEDGEEASCAGDHRGSGSGASQ